MASSTSTLLLNRFVEEKENKNEKQTSVISIDYDNCSDAGEENAYRPLVFLKLADINPLLIEKMKEINTRSTTPLVLFSGSDRQTAELDKLKGQVNGSAFTALRMYQEHLATLNISSHIDPYLVGDTDEHERAGSHFSKYYVHKHYYNPDYHEDEGKIRTLYAQMHRTAIKRPTATIDFHSTNYRDDIIDVLKGFFKNPLYRPRNINLYIYKHDRKGLSLKASFLRDNSPTAPGSVDYNYQRTIQMIRPNYIKRDGKLELINEDSIKKCILTHQNTISSKDRTYFADLIEAQAPISSIDVSQAIVDQLNDSSLPPLAKERLCFQIIHALDNEIKAAPVSYPILNNNTSTDLPFLIQHGLLPKLNEINPTTDLSAYITALLKSKKSPEKIADAFLLPTKSGWPYLNTIATSLPFRLEEVLAAICKSKNGPDKIAEALLVESKKGSSFQQLIHDAPDAILLILEQIKFSPTGVRKLAEALRLKDKNGYTGLHYVLRCNSQLLPKILAVIGESPYSIDCIAQAFLFNGPTGCGLHDVVKYAPQCLPLLMSKIAKHPEGAQFILQALTIVDADKHSGKDAVKNHKDTIVNAFKQSLTHVSPQQLQTLSNDLSAAAAVPAATYRALCKRSNPTFVSKLFAKTTLWKQLDLALSQEIERRKSVSAQSLTFVNIISPSF